MKNFTTIIFAFAVFLLTGAKLNAQSHDEDHGYHGHAFKKFRAAVNMGHVYIPSASLEGEEDHYMIFPVYGFDLQYWFNKKWGVGFKGDIEMMTYFVDHKDEESELKRESPVILSVPVFYNPWENGFGIFIGPGMEFDKHANFWVARLGASYEFEIGNHWDFAPEIIYDLKDGHINTLTFAIAVGKRF